MKFEATSNCTQIIFQIISCFTMIHIMIMYHLVLLAQRDLAIVIVSFLHKSLSSAASLSFSRFIPDIACISSIHLILGRPLFLLPSPHASIIYFSIPFGASHGQRTSPYVFAALCHNEMCWYSHFALCFPHQCMIYMYMIMYSHLNLQWVSMKML